MGMGKGLRLEITEWGILAMVIVIVSVVLLKFRENNVGNYICPTSHPIINETSGACCASATLGPCAGGNTTPFLQGESFISTMVAGLSEPKNWVIIVIVGLIGFALVKMFSKNEE